MVHFFDTEIASKYGMFEAVLFEHISFWIETNKINDINYRDGEYWTYSSVKALGALYPYATDRQIRYALQTLINEKVFKVGNYNVSPYDRTRWFAYDEVGKAIIERRHNELTNLSNGVAEDVQAIPDKSIDISKNNNKENCTIDSNKEKVTRDIRDTKELKVSNRFKKPSIDEIREYCKSKNYNVDAEKFYAYYESNGWKVGRTPMVNWKMATVTWHKRQEEQGKAKSKVDPRYQNPWANDEEYRDLPF